MGKQRIKVGSWSDGDHKRYAWDRNATKENYGISGSKQSLSEMKAFLYPEEVEDTEDKFPEDEESSSSEEEDYMLTEEDLDEIEKKKDNLLY